MDAVVATTRDEAALLLRRLVDTANLALLQRPGPGGGPFWDPRAAERMAADAPEPDATLIRLLLGGQDAPRERLVSLFGEPAIAALEAANLLEVSNGNLCSRLLLASFLNRHVFAAPPPGHPRFSRDLAPYCGPESLWYGRMLALRGPYSRHLDLCTGSGLMTLLPQAESAIGVDLDPAVLPVARFNLELNRRADIEIRHGDLYDAVPGERFDLITANPPFLPQGPRDALPLCGAGGRSGGDIARRILAGIPAHLAEGGEALIYCEGFGDASRPALAADILADRSPDHDYCCWIGSTASAERPICGLVALWSAAGVPEDEAWAHWAALAGEMPTSHYYTMIWQVRPGNGTVSLRQLGPG